MTERFLTLMRLERSRNRWRFFTVFLLLLASFGLLAEWAENDDKVKNTSHPHIARVSVEGMIIEDDYAFGVLEDILEDEKIKAVIVSINSPGGTMVGGLMLYHQLRALSDAGKPVAVVMKTVAASGGYLTALAGDYIVANEGTLTGSIGVVLPLVDATQLAEKVGVRSDDVASGDLKVVTGPLAHRDARATAYLQDVVDTLNKTFYEYVTARRSLSPEVVKTIGDARVVVGTQALEMGLIDALGYEKDAKTWLIKKAALAEDVPVVNYELEEARPWLQQALEGALPGFSVLWQKATMTNHMPAAWTMLR